MKTVLLIINIFLSLLIIILILLQGKGAGLGSAWGGGGEFYHTRRGIESFVFKLLILLVIAFFIISIFNLFIQT